MLPETTLLYAAHSGASRHHAHQQSFYRHLTNEVNRCHHHSYLLKKEV